MFNDGKTNQLVGVYHDNDQTDTILVRVYGENTEQIIDRQNEIKIMQVIFKDSFWNLQNYEILIVLQLFHTEGLSSKIYAIFKNGLAYQHLSGRILDESLACHSNIFPLVAEKMAKFHLQLPMYLELCDGEGEDKTILWEKIYSFIASSSDQNCTKFESDNKRYHPHKTINFEEDKCCDINYETLTRDHNSFIPSKASLFKELEWLTGHLKNFKSPIVMCHNDLLLDNIVYDEEANAVHFIDFEYAGPNFAAYDIANHFNEISGIRIIYL